MTAARVLERIANALERIAAVEESREARALDRKRKRERPSDDDDAPAISEIDMARARTALIKAGLKPATNRGRRS